MTTIKLSQLLSIIYLILGSMTSFLSIAGTSSEALLETEIPAATTTAVIALNTLQNGRVVSIISFESTQSVEQIFEFYRKLWPASTDGPGSMEAAAGQWNTISHIKNGFLVSLQLLNSGSDASSGYLSVMQLEQSTSMNTVSPQLPPGGVLLSTTQHRDISPQAVTWVVHSSAGVELVSAFYRDTLERKGWKLASVRMSAYPHVLIMNGPDSSIEVIVSEAQDGTSVAVVNRVNNHE